MSDEISTIEQLRTDQISQAVQRNCDIADAKSAADYSLCIYLLKMREFYRWEKKLPFDTSLSKEGIGEWITNRESLWESLTDSEYQPLEFDGASFDPFDTDSINAAFVPHGLVYSGGIGTRNHPHFFLAKLLRVEKKNGFTILISTDELARDLTAPPAMTLHNTIFIRRESLRRMIWEKFEEWKWKQHEGAMSRSLQYYDFDSDLDNALEMMTDHELETVLLHELGEIEAGELLDKNFQSREWHEMLAALPRSRSEIMVRAVRDNLADCISTLPSLLEQAEPASLHFFFGNFKAMRKELFPGLQGAYDQWVKNNRTEQIEAIAKKGAHHWLDLAKQILEVFHNKGNQCMLDIETLVLNNKL